eukprot:1610644-Pleurochrysis_carterae.AAC.1
MMRGRDKRNNSNIERISRNILIHSSGDRMFGLAANQGRAPRRASLTTAARAALLDALVLP